MNRSEAFLLLNQHLQNANLIKHSLAVEAGMKKLRSDGEKTGIRQAAASRLNMLQIQGLRAQATH